MIRPLTFWTAPPTHIRVYPCPKCQETISVDAPTCRFCGVPIDLKVAEQLWTENQEITTAIMRANTFGFSSRLAVLITGIGLWILQWEGTLSEPWLICPLLALSYGAQWLSHNSSIVTDDANYLEAVAKVKKTMLIWGAVLLIQLTANFVLNGLADLVTMLQLFVVL